jgi:PhnB protein
MTTINTYLTFDGNCEAAFGFYKSVFSGEFIYIQKFKDMQSDAGVKMSEDELNKIMHI